jgi:hypothetical protein
LTLRQKRGVLEQALGKTGQDPVFLLNLNPRPDPRGPGLSASVHGEAVKNPLFFINSSNLSRFLLKFNLLLLVFGACVSTGEGPEKPETPPCPPGFSLPSEEDSGPTAEILPVPAFDEVWAYLVQGRETALTEGLPISDLGYFGAELDSYGKLVSVPSREDVPPFGGRVHLVVKCDSYSLTHFALKPGSPERRGLVADLLAAARNFDGLQIDFENIPSRDGEQFFSFLAELRASLGDKFFSAALRARTRTLDRDVHDYQKISPLVDRILVMAYDEHWGGSEPGPIAGMEWCRNVAAYAISVIGRGKLIMGLPFYGRAWIEPSPARAYTYPQIETLLNENGVREIQREEGIPAFEYERPVIVKGYYEDAVSLGARLRMYSDMGVRAVGFWRLGQEDPAVWNTLQLGEAPAG